MINVCILFFLWACAIKITIGKIDSFVVNSNFREQPYT